MSSGQLEYQTRYGKQWLVTPDWQILAEIYCIIHGGKWTDADGKHDEGGVFQAYRRLQTLLWPDDDHHEWSDRMLKTILEERITAIQGPKDCSKTHCALSKFALTDFFVYPDKTLILLSSTDIRGLELRVWGDLKDLFARAKAVWPDAPGNCVDYMHGIFTDAIGPDKGGNKIRDIRKGIICIPCIGSDGQWEGLGKYTGTKQARRRLLGDEVQFMEAPYLSSLSNLNKGDFKGVFVGNPIGENDPLDKIAEPEGGWDSIGDITETTTWRNRMGGVTIQLYGPDSPAIKHPGMYPYLIDQTDIDFIGSFWGKDSAEWWNQAMGIRKPGAWSKRVLTVDMAKRYKAMDDVVWKGTRTTPLYSLDAGYGGDRCIGGPGEFGLDIDGVMILKAPMPRVIPVKLYAESIPLHERKEPEDQIAQEVMSDCQGYGIPPQNVFYDATGRGSLGTAFARLWSSDPVPLEFGGNPLPRPVCSDLYKVDEKTEQTRLILGTEYYSKRVTQFWFQIRFVVEAGQLRCLARPVLDELCARSWYLVKGNKKEVEPKEDMKVRFGRSPDLGDWLAILVEGALQRGFVVKKLGSFKEEAEDDYNWRRQLEDRARAIRKRGQLDYTYR